MSEANVEVLKTRECCGCGTTFEDSARRGWSTPSSWRADVLIVVHGEKSKINFCSEGCMELWMEPDQEPTFVLMTKVPA